jgi:hypothetical protein
VPCYSPINREFYLAKGTEKFILGRYLLSGILLSLRPWGVAPRPAILENRGAKSHFCDYFIIRAKYLYLSYYKKCRACMQTPNDPDDDDDDPEEQEENSQEEFPNS